MSIVDGLNQESRKRLAQKNLIAFQYELIKLAPLINDKTISVDEVIDLWASIFEDLPEFKGLFRQLCTPI